MPDYEFKAPDGTVKTKFFPISRAPALGSTVEIDGQPCVRIISPSIVVDGNPLSTRYPVVSRFLKKGHPDCPQDPKTGRAIITSKNHEDYICKKYGYAKDGDDE